MIIIIIITGSFSYTIQVFHCQFSCYAIAGNSNLVNQAEPRSQNKN